MPAGGGGPLADGNFSPASFAAASSAAFDCTDSSAAAETASFSNVFDLRCVRALNAPSLTAVSPMFFNFFLTFG